MGDVVRGNCHVVAFGNESCGLRGEDHIGVQAQIVRSGLAHPSRLRPEFGGFEHSGRGEWQVAKLNFDKVEIGDPQFLTCAQQLAANFVVADFRHHDESAFGDLAFRPERAGNIGRIGFGIAHQTQRPGVKQNDFTHRRQQKAAVHHLRPDLRSSLFSETRMSRAALPHRLEEACPEQQWLPPGSLEEE